MRLKSKSISNARAKKGWTQEHLANVAGVSARTVQRAESRNALSAETAQILCAVLDLNLEEIADVELGREQHTQLPKWLIVSAIAVGFAIGLIVGLSV